MKINNVFLFPMHHENLLNKKHPYIAGVCIAMGSNFNVLNYGKKSRLGIFSLIKYHLKPDILYLNWVEDSGSRKFGIVQSVFIIFSVLIYRLLNKKIVWTHHNICTHSGANKWNTFLISFMAKFSTHIICHTKESYKYFKKKYWKKMHYFYHPVTNFKYDLKDKISQKYDILIWGSIRRSKGVESFLNFLKDKNLLRSFKIHIVGNISDPHLENEIMEYLSNNIIIENRFVEDNELFKLHLESRYVLYPYSGESVLVSGAMVRSLPLQSIIIGPNKGAFKDLKDLNLLLVYENFDDIVSILGNYNTVNHEGIGDFIVEHTWDNFGLFLSKTIN